MAERNNNLMICSLLNTEPAGRGSWGPAGCGSENHFLREPFLGEIPSEPSLGWHASDPLRAEYSPTWRAQGTGAFIKI